MTNDFFDQWFIQHGGEENFERVRAQYTSRAYHNLDHIYYCLNVAYYKMGWIPLPQYGHKVVYSAIWMHDAFQDINQDLKAVEASADLARDIFWKDNEKMSEAMYKAILATRHSPDPMLEECSALVVDADLAILGDEWPIFLEYESKVRQEYPISDERWVHGRREFLSRFLNRKYIYHTAEFRHSFEDKAIQNITRMISILHG